MKTGGESLPVFLFGMLQLPSMIEVAKRAAIAAGEISLNLRGNNHKILDKGKPSDFATEVDILSEKVILETLKEAFPNHGFLMEESGVQNVNSEFVWVIDPLDGTISYSSGLPIYGISIGLLKNNEPILGVINLPALSQLYWAEKDNGAFLNEKAIQVNDNSSLLKAVVGSDLGHTGGRKKEIKELFLPLSEEIRYLNLLGSAAAGMVYVSSGLYSAYIHKAYRWDYAAGVVITKEAGGKVTDYRGNSLDWSKEMLEVVASNGLIHNQILDIIKK